MTEVINHVELDEQIQAMISSKYEHKDQLSILSEKLMGYLNQSYRCTEEAKNALTVFRCHYPDVVQDILESKHDYAHVEELVSLGLLHELCQLLGEKRNQDHAMHCRLTPEFHTQVNNYLGFSLQLPHTLAIAGLYFVLARYKLPVINVKATNFTKLTQMYKPIIMGF